ncbi:MAG: PIN domain-containing protein [Candidatus Eremiobacteraeota bacterium]|nr:PIN domain-containing protein [Candidatus Eremiobacteraeota bacterium]
MTYVDTSAFLAVLLGNDINHGAARKIWEGLLESGEPLVSSNYVIVETISLLQNRVGVEAVRAFLDSIAPLLHVEWVDAVLHRIGTESLIAAGRRSLSLVDCTSFALMRKRDRTCLCL